jgi:GNAT superfamily N-acetyltransferase
LCRGTLPPVTPLNRPGATQTSRNARDRGSSHHDDATLAAMTIAEQIDRAVPIGRRRPREPELCGTLAELSARVRQPLRIDTEQGIQRFDFYVEPLHQRHGHGSQIGQAAADRNLRDRIALRTDGGQKVGQLVDEPRSEIVTPRLIRVGRQRIVRVAPRQLACAQ